MTTLFPRRDALIAATAAARTAGQALPPARDRIDELGREVSHGVLEAALIPMAEAVDLGADIARAQTMLTHALAATIMNFSAFVSLDDGQSQSFAIGVLEELVFRTRSFAEKASEIQIPVDYDGLDVGRAH